VNLAQVPYRPIGLQSSNFAITTSPTHGGVLSLARSDPVGLRTAARCWRDWRGGLDWDGSPRISPLRMTSDIVRNSYVVISGRRLQTRGVLCRIAPMGLWGSRCGSRGGDRDRGARLRERHPGAGFPARPERTCGHMERERQRCKMKRKMIIGIVLIVLGAIGLVVQGITYTTREKVVDVAGVQITAEREKTIPIPLIAGGLALAAGIAVVVVASRNSRKP